MIRPVRALLLAALLTGCGSRPGPRPPPSDPPVDDPETNEPPPDGAAPPVYAALFELGATWTFTVESDYYEAYDDDYYVDETGYGGEPDDPGELLHTCEVARVGEFSGGALSEITCDWDFDEDPLTGAWASNGRGVWRLGDWPIDGETPVLVDAEMFLAAAPEASSTTETSAAEDDLPEVTFGSSIEPGPSGGWCWSRWVESDGSASSASLCLDADGPIRGSVADDSGGSSAFSIEFTRTGR